MRAPARRSSRLVGDGDTRRVGLQVLLGLGLQHDLGFGRGRRARVEAGGQSVLVADGSRAEPYNASPPSSQVRLPAGTRRRRCSPSQPGPRQPVAVGGGARRRRRLCRACSRASLARRGRGTAGDIPGERCATPAPAPAAASISPCPAQARRLHRPWLPSVPRRPPPPCAGCRCWR